MGVGNFSNKNIQSNDERSIHEYENNLEFFLWI